MNGDLNIPTYNEFNSMLGNVEEEINDYLNNL